MSRNTIFSTILMLLITLSVSAAIPEKPLEKKLLWDYAGILSPSEEAFIEDSLESFSRNTSNQIVVMTVTNDILDGYDLSEFGQQVGEKWGVGYQGKNNGVVILIKPKTGDDAMGKGRAFITTGYGAEGPLPDLLCSNIVDEKMVPFFKDNDYASGVMAALDVIKPALQGDFNEAEDLMSSDAGDALLSIIVVILILCFVLAVASKNNNDDGNGNNTRTYTGGPIIFPGSFNSGRSSGGSWSGGGGFGGGGWGGFGGGSFGGGGGGGSW